MDISPVTPNANTPIINPVVNNGGKFEAPLIIADGDDKKQKAIDGSYTCKTCESRRYQDGSNDPGVSFKAPTKLTPNQAASAVPAHEREHYSRESAKAESEGREVVSSNIRIFTSICPECGRTYVSGGETSTVTRKKEENASFLKNGYEAKVGALLPKKFDVTAS